MMKINQEKITVKVPENCHFLDNDEMMYVEGGLIGTAYWRLGELKEALRSLMLLGLTNTMAALFRVNVYSPVATYSWAYHASSAFNTCDWLINHYGAHRTGCVTTAYKVTGEITGMSVGLV